MMKVKRTNKGNIKITLTEQETRRIQTILCFSQRIFSNKGTKNVDVAHLESPCEETSWALWNALRRNHVSEL